MCIITYNFVDNAKYNMGSIGYRPKEEKDFDLTKVKELVVDQMFRLKDLEKSFYLAYHYSWITSHWRKILKAKDHHKWNDGGIQYSQSDVKKNKEHYDNLAFSTNLFGNKYDTYYLDENDKIVHELINKSSKHNNDIDGCEIVKINDEFSCLFETSYLKTLKKKSKADTDKALATIQTMPLDYNKGIFISFVILDEENISKTALVKGANGVIDKAVSQALAVKTMKMMSTIAIVNSINTINRMNRLNSVNTFRRF